MIDGLEHTSYNDPMISKVIAWGADRTAALDTLDEALAGYTALGIETNVEYLRLLINDPDVRAGHLDTGLIERKLTELAFRRLAEPELVAAALYALEREEQENTPAPSGPWRNRKGWRLGPSAPRRISLGTPDGGVATVRVSGGRIVDGPVRVTVDNGAERQASLEFTSRRQAVLSLDGKAVTYSFAPVYTGPVTPAWDNPAPARPTELFLGNEGWSCRLEVLTRETRLTRVLAAIHREEGAADPEVRSPMPGTVVSVAVSDGDTVTAGQLLLSVEAMKMEHQLSAEVAGTVHISAKAGDLVKLDQVLATIHETRQEPIQEP
jgi:acetyl-CoA/propionyl-CoA carboxylase biotin carboxyl carrier protein